jgi:NAD(P)-dependent dehydrogenase (short-subunit alcohol dehydrogenase family)
MIAPGTFETPLNRPLLNQPGRRELVMGRTPMKRPGNLEEIKGAAIYLASDSASYITGQVVAVDGGFLAQGIGF